MRCARRVADRQTVRLALTAAIAAAVLASCGGDDSPAATPTATTGAMDVTATAAVFVPSLPASVGAIVWTTGVDPVTREPVDVVDRFSTTAAAIYAAVPVTNAGPATVIRAEWTYNATSLDGTAVEIRASNGMADGWLEFHLEKPPDAAWPSGRYEITVSLDGAPVQSSGVDVE